MIILSYRDVFHLVLTQGFIGFDAYYRKENLRKGKFICVQ